MRWGKRSIEVEKMQAREILEGLKRTGIFEVEFRRMADGEDLELLVSMKEHAYIKDYRPEV